MNYKDKIAEIEKSGESYGKPIGNSMLPRIYSGEKILFKSQKNYQIDDIVLCKVKGSFMVHKIVSVNDIIGYQIANNKGHINGWTNKVFAKAFDLEGNEK